MGLIGDRPGEQAERLGFLVDGYSEVIPTADTGVTPVIDAAQLRPRRGGPHRGGQSVRPGWRPDLVCHHRQFVPLAHQAQHGLDKIVAETRVDPAGAQDERLRQRALHRQLAIALAAPVLAQWRGRRLWRIGLGCGAIENEVGGNMNQPGTTLRAGPRQHPRALGVAAVRGCGLGLCFIHGGVRRCIDNQLRRRRGERSRQPRQRRRYPVARAPSAHTPHPSLRCAAIPVRAARRRRQSILLVSNHSLCVSTGSVSPGTPPDSAIIMLAIITAHLSHDYMYASQETGARARRRMQRTVLA